MTPPTDLELMMLYDGELEEPRRAEVAAFVEGSADAQAKIVGLSLSTELISTDLAPPSSAADGIADLVMTAIADEKPAQAQKPRPAAKVLSETRKVEAPAAANDNGRTILGLAGFAAAAAAALFLWGKSAPVEAPTAPVATVGDEAPTPVHGSETSRVSQATSTRLGPAPPVESVQAPPVEDEEVPTVEVASVDFSARSGAVYYVASESKGQTTAVVWLKDE